MQSLSTVFIDRNKPLTSTPLGLSTGQLFVHNGTLHMYLSNTSVVALSGLNIGKVDHLRARWWVTLATGKLTYKYLYPGDDDA